MDKSRTPLNVAQVDQQADSKVAAHLAAYLHPLEATPDNYDLSYATGGLVAIRIDDINAAVNTASTTLAIAEASAVGLNVSASPVQYARYYGVPLTFAAPLDFVSNPAHSGSLSKTQLLDDVYTSGVELISHSKTHDLPPDGDAAIYAEIVQSKNDLENLTITGRGFPRDECGFRVRGFIQPGTWTYSLSANILATSGAGDPALIVTRLTRYVAQTGYLMIGTEQIHYTSIDLATGVISGLTRGANGTTAAAHAAGVLNVNIYDDGSCIDSIADMDSPNAVRIRQTYQWSMAYLSLPENIGQMPRYFSSVFPLLNMGTSDAAVLGWLYKRSLAGRRTAVLFHFAYGAEELAAFKRLVDAIVALRDDRTTYPLRSIYPVTLSALILGTPGAQRRNEAGTAIVEPRSAILDADFVECPVGVLDPANYGKFGVAFSKQANAVIEKVDPNIMRLTTSSSTGAAFMYVSFQGIPGRHYMLGIKMSSAIVTSYQNTSCYAPVGDTMTGASINPAAGAILVPVPAADGWSWTPVFIPTWSNGSGRADYTFVGDGAVDITRVKIVQI